LTAASLIDSGTALLLNWSWERDMALVAAGLLLYTAIVSPGYFAQQGIWPAVVMFGILYLITTWITTRLLKR
jgi:hypothetical protein